MRVIGIDLGTKTMGLAITDLNKTIASSLSNFEFTKNNYEACINKLKSVFKQYNNEIDTIVLGLPLKMSGKKNEWTLTVEKFGNTLSSIFQNVRIIFQDERMTTINAVTFLKEDLGLKASKIKKIKDKMSAVIILQEYLDIYSKQKEK
ncbi:MAG: Holliday junction resolvase RuvX [Mycoplasmoidaceae bacterium]|nr:MAG: Holliday junction resolvase RuvX [Mycoplasmoidaceae bacterium]